MLHPESVVQPQAGSGAATADPFLVNVLLGYRGECGRLIAARDWSATLGPIESWPQSLRTTVAILLRSSVPLVLLWGTDGIMLYNDAYSVFAGGRHPGLLGAKVRQGWPEVADFNDNVMKVGLAGGTLAYKDQELTLYRHGCPEQVWMDLDYSPVLDEQGRPAGVLAIVVETSQRVHAQRQARDSEAKLRAALEQLPIGVTLAEVPGGAVLHMNRAGAAIVGDAGQPQAVGNYDQWGAQHGDGRPYAPNDYPLARAALAGEVVDREPMTYRRPDGAIVQLEVSAAPVTDSDGRPLLAVCTFADVTERHRAESALRDSEARLRRAHEAGQIGSYEWDMAGPGHQSDSMLRLAGLPVGCSYSLKEILATVHPDDRPQVMRTVDAIGKGADRVETDYRVCWPDGTVRWLRDIGQLERDDYGKPHRWVGIVQDVTDRSLAEARLRENEERLRLAAAAAQMGTWDLDLASGIGRWDEAAMRMFRLATDSATYDSSSWLRLVHPEDRARVDEAFNASLAPGGPDYSIEFRAAWQDPEGHDCWLMSHGTILRDGSGHPVRTVGIVRDVTERRRELERLRKSEEQLRISLAAGRMVAWEIDGPTGIMRRTSTADDVLGPGDSTEDIRARMPPEDAKMVRQAADRAFANPGSRYEVEFRYRHSDGRQLWMHNRGEVQHDVAGHVPRAYGVCMDITARKSAEMALRDLNERLEAEVQRRSDELLQAQDALRQSQKMEALGQLTGGVAHDFNNLLGAVVGSLDLIRRRADNPERVRHFAEVGLEAAEKGARLTSQLLAFSRAQRIEVRPVNAAALVQGMQDLLARTLGPMITVWLDLESHTTVLGDPTQLELALLNLAINSRDAMRNRPGGQLTISCHPVDLSGDIHLGDGRYVELSVRDNGSGMPPEVAARAFDPFFTTKGLGEGTGLGLSQVHGIVRQSGGDVRIESQPGQGTTVRMLLPRTGDNEGVGAAPSDAMLQQWAGRVLVIDDDRGVRAMLAGALEMLGFEPEFATSGDMGLARLAVERPRLVILDYAMPGRNGADIAAEIRLRHAGLPVLFCTGYADSNAIAGAAGPDAAVLRKPFRLAELHDAIAAVLSA